jgi:hypothetical protein
MNNREVSISNNMEVKYKSRHYIMHFEPTEKVSCLRY